jgi:transcriptional regulator with XRE-family HTH domain
MGAKTKVEELRLAKGWTREKLAVEANISPSTLGRIERGQASFPYMSTVSAIAKALGVDIDDLVVQMDLPLE